jgi:hypothetical protein
VRRMQRNPLLAAPHDADGMLEEHSRWTERQLWVQSGLCGQPFKSASTQSGQRTGALVISQCRHISRMVLDAPGRCIETGASRPRWIRVCAVTGISTRHERAAGMGGGLVACGDA